MVSFLLQAVNIAFTIIFTIEMVLKHCAYGFLKYWMNAYDVLDGIIVISSLIELAMNGHGRLQSLRNFRLLRILRAFKLLRAFGGLRKLMKSVLKVSLLTIENCWPVHMQ